MQQEEIASMLRSAIPIDGIDQLLMGSDGFAIVWIDIAERPDVHILAEKVQTRAGYSICRWFYAYLGQPNMVIGLQVEVREPSHFVFHLAFRVAEYVDQLTTIGRYGKLWIVPGPPDHRRGVTTMDTKTFISKVLSTNGQGLFISLQEHLAEELRARLIEWKQKK